MNLPETSEETDFRIDREGNWWHRGRIISKEALVKLYAGKALRCENGEYWLRSPTEAYRIEVEDVPFIFTGYEVRGQGTEEQAIDLTTNLGETVELGPAAPLEVEGGPGQGVVIFYAEVREGLKARCNRNVNYDLVAHFMEEGEDGLVIRSRGASFVVAGDY